MSKYDKIDPTIAKFLKELDAQNSAPLYTLSYEDARQVLVNAQSDKGPRPEVDIKDFDIPFENGGKVDLRILRPQGKDEKLPVILYVHGGGWVMGDKLTHDRLVRELAVGSNAAVVYVNYTPSPEAQYPVITNQVYCALEYIVKKADELNLDASRIAIAGDSAGGNMATVVAMMCKEKNGPKLCLQLLLYPVTVAGYDTESYQEFADGPWLTRKAMQYFWDAYAPDAKTHKDPHVSPLLATPEQLKGLPPAFVITDANDVLRDEGEAYAIKLMQAGVPTGAVRYNGAIHDFMMLDAIADAVPVRAAIAQSCCVLRKAFCKKEM